MNRFRKTVSDTLLKEFHSVALLSDDLMAVAAGVGEDFARIEAEGNEAKAELGA